MKIRSLVLALALTLPLILYGVPYAYAVTTGHTYTNSHSTTVCHVTSTTTCFAAIGVLCNTGDYATGGGFDLDNLLTLYNSQPLNFPTTNAGWTIQVSNPTTSDLTGTVFAVCQMPITVAGIGVPEFGTIYLAVALGALVYFLLARRYSFAKAPTRQS